MLLRAHPGIDLAAGGRQEIHLHPALGKAGLQRLGDGDKRRFVLHIKGEVGILNARFIEDSLSFLRIKGERISLQRPRQAGRQEALVNKVLAFQQIFGDALIIDQPARRLPEGRVIEQRVGAVGGIKHQVVLLGGRDAQHLHAGFILQGGNLVSAEIARHVGIPLLDQQAAGSRVGDVFNNDALDLRRAGWGAGVGLQHDGLMRLVDAHFIGPAARRVHLQPVVAEVVIFRVRRHLFFIHDRGDGGGENIQRHRRADVGGPVQRQGMVINLFQLAGDVVRLPAEHVENKRWRFIQRHRTGVRENHIFRAQRITGGEFGIRLQFNGQGFRRRIGLPAFGEDRYDFFRVVAVGLHQTLIEAGDRLNAGEFVSFRRVEADDIVETLGDHQRVGRRGGMRGGGERRQ